MNYTRLLRTWGMASLLALLLILLGRSQTAEGHGYIVRSIPRDRSVISRAPAQVQIWFSEGLEPRFSTIEVFNQQGEQIDLGDGGVDARNRAKLVVSLPTGLPQGAYLVKIRPVFTSDGHAVSDTLVFWIGEQLGDIEAGGASDRASTFEALWRIVLNLSLIVFFGTVLSYSLILRPAWGNALGRLPLPVMRLLSRLLWSSLGVALVTNLLALLQITTKLFETDLGTVLRDELWNIVLAGTNFGDVWQYRMALLVAMLFVQIVAAQQARNRPANTYVLWLVNGFLAALALGTISLISHAAGSPFWKAPSLLLNYVHLMAVASWIGGLIVISLSLRPALQPLPPQERGRALLAALRRFSVLGLVSVSIIIITGIYNAALTVTAPRDLAESTYGLTLVSKWILILPLLGLGALHHLVISPQRMARLAKFLQTHQRFARLPITLRMEMVFALAVLFAAGWLPATPPPIPQNARGEVETASRTQTIEAYQITLAVSPSAVGANSIDVTTTRNGEPAEFESVRLRFSYPKWGIYTPPLVLDQVEAGSWAAASGDLSRAGTWDVLIDLDPPDAPPVRAAFRQAIQREVEDPNGRSPTYVHWGTLLLSILVVGLWLAPLLAGSARRLTWTPESIVIAVLSIAMTAGIAVGGAFLFARTGQNVREQRSPAPEQVNPIFADQDSVLRGRTIYEAQCLLCHGADGAGHMPATLNLPYRTPNLADSLSERDDADLYRILAKGLTNRHQYGAGLAERDLWHLINFLRSLP